MSYLVLCTFDLENASLEDYKNAYRVLEEIGLYKEAIPKSGTAITLPNTVTMGEFNGDNVSLVKENILVQIKNKFKALRLKSKIFITVSSGWSWSQATT